MKIEHIALWVSDLEAVRTFYQEFFGMQAGEKYENSQKGFTSYFLTCGHGGARLEIMHRADIMAGAGTRGLSLGLAHFALSVGSPRAVDQLTQRIREAGHRIVGEPRTTGDGYYESVCLDPEGNRVEITE